MYDPERMCGIVGLDDLPFMLGREMHHLTQVVRREVL